MFANYLFEVFGMADPFDDDSFRSWSESCVSTVNKFLTACAGAASRTSSASTFFIEYDWMAEFTREILATYIPDAPVVMAMDFGKQPALVARDAAGYFREIELDIKFDKFEATRA